MIAYEDVSGGFYWGIWGKSEEKVLITVYGHSPFFKADIWMPSFGKTGMHVDNVDVIGKSVRFIERIKEINKED